MDGVSATHVIREGNGPNALTPIVAVTAHAMPEEVEQFRKAGMTHTLTKRVDRCALRAVIHATQGTAKAQLNTITPEAKATGPTAIPLIDESKLAELIEAVGQARALRILDRFTSQVGALAGAGDNKGEGYDAENFIAAVHALSGSAGLIGAMALHDRLAKIETAFKTDGIEPDLETRGALRKICIDTTCELSDLAKDLNRL